jgi:hypothetical protein
MKGGEYIHGKEKEEGSKEDGKKEDFEEKAKLITHVFTQKILRSMF